MNPTARAFVSAAVATAIGIVFGYYLAEPATEYVVQERDVVHVVVDTVQVPVVVPGRVVYVERATVRVDTIDADTVYETPAFVATLDTIADGDTVTASFTYEPPAPPTMSVVIRQAPREVLANVPSKTVYLETVKTAPPRHWLVDAATHFAAAALGYGVGRVTP